MGEKDISSRSRTRDAKHQSLSSYLPSRYRLKSEVVHTSDCDAVLRRMRVARRILHVGLIHEQYSYG